MQKKNNMNKHLILVIIITAFSLSLKAQALFKGIGHLEDYYRIEQLKGNIDLNHSFVSYPLFPVYAFDKKNPFDPLNKLENQDSRFKLPSSNFRGVFEFEKGRFSIKLLPIHWKQQINTHHPEGFNDGAMIPSRGYQSILTTGFYFKYDHLSIKIQPEFVSAKNLDYEGFPGPITGNHAYLNWFLYYYSYLNRIDDPKMFGEGTYSSVYWGQSSIRLTFNSVSLGFSTENVWWGPGMRNSLIMTNNASGFAHFTLNSVKPIKTYIGSFEGQIIAGWLKDSGYDPPGTEFKHADGKPFYLHKPTEDRYINGMVISYQPKWIPGLFIGVIRSFQIYSSEMGTEVADYLPVFGAISRKSAEDESGGIKPFDFYNSVFFRFVWPESHVEIYGEFGRNDFYWDKSDLILQAEHSSAYNLGFRKLIPLKRRDAFIQVHFELTQVAMNANTLRRNGISWYSGNYVVHGYTHKGQLLGAGLGSGGNMQSFEISWLRNLKKVGLRFERFVHNEDFFNKYITNIRAHWVDLSATLLGNWDYKNLMFSAKFKAVSSLNYMWAFSPNAEDFWDTSGGNDIFNLHAQIGITYRF